MLDGPRCTGGSLCSIKTVTEMIEEAWLGSEVCRATFALVVLGRKCVGG